LFTFCLLFISKYVDIALELNDMYHKGMTIKRRLFFSYIRIIIIAFVAFGLIVRIAAFLLFGTGKPDPRTIAYLRDTYGQYIFMLLWVLILAFFIVFISLLNSILTHRMTKRIVKPLEPLNEGVRQIQNNNFAYRIDYKNNDEFRPICDAFNQMAAQLEASTERRLKDEANRRELLAGISHDLRTPLTTINGYLDGLESGVASTPEMRGKYFLTIKNRAADMKHIIEQLFLFSKLDMDEYPFLPRRFVLMRTLSDMVEELTEEYAMRGLNITIDDKSVSVSVCADVSHFRRVLINILENSVKYKEKETGRMIISASRDSNFMQIKFSDDGPGVESDMLPNLFNVFYRTDPSRHTKGSGLGLAISAKIIERSGGTIQAENNDSGGLTIVIRLPVAA
jgi:signal transduction histidine kinase